LSSTSVTGLLSLLSAGGTGRWQGSGTEAYQGLWLDEDQEITSFFIQSAFPAEGSCSSFRALDQADDSLF